MTRFIPFSRDQAFLLPPDAKDWLPADDVAHFVVAAVERLLLGAFAVRPIPGGKAHYHPRLLLALLIYCYANGMFSSRRIERATYRDIGVRYVAATLHPDHDTIAAFRRANRAAFEGAFLQVLLLARESGLLRLGRVAIDGTKIDADASRIRSLRDDRAKELRAKLAAETEGRPEDTSPHSPPAPRRPTPRPSLTRRRCPPRSPGARRCRPGSMPPAPGSRRRRAPRPKPPGRATRPGRPPTRRRRVGAAARPGRPRKTRRPLGNATSPTPTARCRRSDAHEYRQAYNAQAVVCAEGSQLILATGVVAIPADAPSFASTVRGMKRGIGLPKTVLADAGFASAEAVAVLAARKIEPLLAIGRTQPHRAYDFRPPRPRQAPHRVDPDRPRLQLPQAASPAARRLNPNQPTNQTPDAKPTGC